MKERFLPGLVRNVSAGTRLALFLPVRWLHFRATPGQFALLAGFNLMVWALSSTLQAGSGTLNPQAIAVYLSQIPLLLLASLAIAAIYGNTSLAMLLAVALSASDLAFELAGLAAFGPGLEPAMQFAGWGLFLLWGWAVAVRATVVCTGAPWRGRRTLASASVVLALIVLSVVLLPRVELWTAEPEAAEAPSELVREEVFHSQGELIERQLAAIEAGREGTTELYFVGFAPDGSQDVFRREMRSAKAIVEQAYDAGRRSISLVSNPATLAENPIATATNLRRTLAHVAKRMNADEDVLMLFVTAHGDEGFGLSAHAPPLDLAPVNPTVVARALNDAGVKWRVLVISACYSGGFIEPLKDDNTLIITASAADRRSFGCETGNEWTYFGEAYFNQALRASHSFIEAFPLAAKSVAQREASEGLKPPSNPQIFVGKAIAEKLRQLK
ncbi:unnamed protein product [Phaeothamnion confervicola]